MILQRDIFNNFNCSICGYKNSRTHRFLEHLHSKHSISSDSCEYVYACKFCSKRFTTGQQCGGHSTQCKLNPNAVETSEKIRKTMIGRPAPLVTTQKISDTVNARIAAGTWHNSFARARKHVYQNESFDGTWELLLAQWFDANEILWERNKLRFPYTFEGKVRSYEPDFFLSVQNCFVEVKGWKTPKDEAKWQAFPHRLIVLSGTDLQNLGIAITVRCDWKYPSMAVL